jgi:hypothetical protein
MVWIWFVPQSFMCWRFGPKCDKMRGSRTFKWWDLLRCVLWSFGLVSSEGTLKQTWSVHVLWSLHQSWGGVGTIPQDCELNKPLFFIKLACLRYFIIVMRNGPLYLLDLNFVFSSLIFLSLSNPFQYRFCLDHPSEIHCFYLEWDLVVDKILESS